MRTGERLWIFAAALSLVLLQQALGASLADIFAEGVPGFGTAPGVTVRSRTRPDSETAPIHAGSLRVKPGFEEAIGYDDNVLSGPTRRGSWLTSTGGSILIGSDWSRHAFGAYLSATDTRYAEQPRQSRTDGTVSVGGSLEIGRDRLTLGIAHLSLHEDRSELNALASDRPVPFRVDDARLSYTASFDRLSVTPEVEISAWHYGDTTVLGQFARQNYRDRTMLRGGTVVRYEFAPLRNLVFLTRALSQRYDAPAAGQASLNSTGYQALLGIDYDEDTVWRARLLIGGETRQFAAPRYRSHTAMIAEGELTWNPTGMTTLRSLLSRTIEDAAQEGVSGFTYTAGKLGIDHEIVRDLLFATSIGFRRASFLQGGQQTGASAGVGLTWLLNRYTKVSATYDLNTVHGAGPLSTASSGYARDVALLTVRLGL
ncbi:MAG: outer membrane beta-barrel protein [Rhodospirillales bacterium]